MMTSNYLSEQRRGTNGWAIDELLFRGLKGLIKDLRVLEKKGFAEEICLQVQNALTQISKAVVTGTGASFTPEIIVEGGRFHQRYIEWNNNGTNGGDPTIKSRRNLINELFFWRMRMIEKLIAGRKGFKFFATEDDFTIVRGVYEKLEIVTSEYPNTFPSLKKSVETFFASMKKRDKLP